MSEELDAKAREYAEQKHPNMLGGPADRAHTRRAREDSAEDFRAGYLAAQQDRGEKDKREACMSMGRRAFLGFPIVFDARLDPDVVEFRHPDGRIERFRLEPTPPSDGGDDR